MKSRLIINGLLSTVILVSFSCNSYNTKNYKDSGLSNLNFNISIPNNFSYLKEDTFNFYGNHYQLSIFSNIHLGRNDTFQIRHLDKYTSYTTDSIMTVNFPNYIKNQKNIRSREIWLSSGDTIINNRKFYLLDSYRELENDTIYYYGEFSTIYNDSLYSFIYKSKCLIDSLDRSIPFNILSTLTFKK